VRGGPHSGGSDGWAAAAVSRSAEDRRSERRRRRRRWYLQLGRRGTGGRERRQRIGAWLAGHGVQLGGHGNGKCRLGERAGEGRGKERERVERAGELGSALKHGKKASWRTARALEATRQRSAAAVSHEHYCSSNFKISIPPRKYKLKSHFPPLISPKPIDYLLHRLHHCVGLQEYSNLP